MVMTPARRPYPDEVAAREPAGWRQGGVRTRPDHDQSAAKLDVRIDIEQRYGQTWQGLTSGHGPDLKEAISIHASATRAYMVLDDRFDSTSPHNPNTFCLNQCTIEGL